MSRTKPLITIVFGTAIAVLTMLWIYNFEKPRDSWPRAPGVIAGEYGIGNRKNVKPLANYYVDGKERGALNLFYTSDIHYPISGEPRYKKGDPVTVAYNPQMPDEHIVLEHRGDWKMGFIITLCIGGFIILTGFVKLMGRKR